MDMGCCNSEFHALCDRQTTPDDRITRETRSYDNPCPSSPSSTIYIHWRRKRGGGGGQGGHVPPTFLTGGAMVCLCPPTFNPTFLFST